MAQSFCKIFLEGDENNNEAKLKSWVSFWIGRSLASEEFKVYANKIDNEGNMSYVEWSDFYHSFKKTLDVSVLFPYDDDSSIYARYRYLSDKVIWIEDYDFGETGYSESIDSIIRERISSLSKNLIGAIIDEKGYLEEVNWDEFFMDPVRSDYESESVHIFLP